MDITQQELVDNEIVEKYMQGKCSGVLEMVFNNGVIRLYLSEASIEFAQEKCREFATKREKLNSKNLRDLVMSIDPSTMILRGSEVFCFQTDNIN